MSACIKLQQETLRSGLMVLPRKRKYGGAASVAKKAGTVDVLSLPVKKPNRQTTALVSSSDDSEEERLVKGRAELARLQQANERLQNTELVREQERLATQRKENERLKAMQRRLEADELRRESETLRRENEALIAKLQAQQSRSQASDPAGVSRNEKAGGEKGVALGADGVHNKDRTLAATAVVRAARAPNKDRALAAREMKTGFARGRQLSRPTSSVGLEVPWLRGDVEGDSPGTCHGGPGLASRGKHVGSRVVGRANGAQGRLGEHTCHDGPGLASKGKHVGSRDVGGAKGAQRRLGEYTCHSGPGLASGGKHVGGRVDGRPGARGARNG